MHHLITFVQVQFSNDIVSHYRMIPLLSGEFHSRFRRNLDTRIFFFHKQYIKFRFMMLTSLPLGCLSWLMMLTNITNAILHSMPIHVLQWVFHVEKLFCTHRFFHKYKQTRTEKFGHALLLILMREVYLQRSMMLSKYSR